jgi:hypothetical protein
MPQIKPGILDHFYEFSKKRQYASHNLFKASLGIEPVSENTVTFVNNNRDKVPFLSLSSLLDPSDFSDSGLTNRLDSSDPDFTMSADITALVDVNEDGELRQDEETEEDENHSEISLPPFGPKPARLGLNGKPKLTTSDTRMFLTNSKAIRLEKGTPMNHEVVKKFRSQMKRHDFEQKLEDLIDPTIMKLMIIR